MLQFILLGSGAGQRRKNGKRSPAPTFPILQIGWLLQLDSLHIHWASLRLKLVVLSCAVCGCSFGKPSEAHARNGDFSGCRGSAKGLGLNCRGFPPKARRRSADRRQATFKFIYASGGRGRGGGLRHQIALVHWGGPGRCFPLWKGGLVAGRLVFRGAVSNGWCSPKLAFVSAKRSPHRPLRPASRSSRKPGWRTGNEADQSGDKLRIPFCIADSVSGFLPCWGRTSRVALLVFRVFRL